MIYCLLIHLIIANISEQDQPNKISGSKLFDTDGFPKIIEKTEKNVQREACKVIQHAKTEMIICTYL